MSFLTAKKISDKNNEYVYINLENVGFLKIKKENEDKGMNLEVVYRKKATEKFIEFKTSHDKEGFRKFIQQHKFYLLENYFINIKAIDFVDEFVDGLKEITLHFYFKDGQNLTIKTQRARWENWQNLRLK